MKRAIVTGITGQDGSYLAELLLDKGYEVHGLVRPQSLANTARIDHLLHNETVCTSRLSLHYGDLSDQTCLHSLLQTIKPHEFYNLAAQSHVGHSFLMPEYTATISGQSTLLILEAIRKLSPETRFYQASTSELYGNVRDIPQNEHTPFHPRSPYAVAKLFAYWATVNYREAYHLHASNGILFNHESPRRGEAFVTRKITRALARIVAGRQRVLRLENLAARRDWGYAKDYVEAMWLMLQQPSPDDYVVATGETRSVQEFLDTAFTYVGLDWRNYVEVDPTLYRPSEVDLLLGDATKARQHLGWQPRITFQELVEIMVREDLRLEGLTDCRPMLGTTGKISLSHDQNMRSRSPHRSLSILRARSRFVAVS
jgi:GDPmannose 4,6-dehydratase